MLAKRIVNGTVLAVGLAASSVSVAQEPIRVGAAVYGLRAEFMQLWRNAIEEHPAVKSGEVNVTVFDGRYDALVQKNQFDTMITQQYDGAVFVPIDAQACASPVAKAAGKGIPVVGSNTRCESDQLASYVGSDDVRAGEMVANSVIREMGGSGNVVILEGPIGQSAQVDRAEGIQNVLDNHPNVTVLEKKTAEWSRAQALSLMENWLTSHRGEIDGVIGQNDEMALGAIQAIESSSEDVEDFAIAGVDGVTDALKAVKAGKMESVLQDARAQAQGALDVVLSGINDDHEPQSDIWEMYGDRMSWDGGGKDLYEVPWTPVTEENVDELLERRSN